MHANPFPALQSQSSHPLQLIHTDVHGPLPIRTHSGFRYWVSLLMTIHGFGLSFQSKPSRTPLKHSRLSKHMPKTTTVRRLELYEMTREGNICPMHSWSSLRRQAF